MALAKKGSYGHSINRVGEGRYRLNWTVDFKYEGSRLRHPRGYSRLTDRDGAVRFAEKWSVRMPPEPGPAASDRPASETDASALSPGRR